MARSKVKVTNPSKLVIWPFTMGAGMAGLFIFGLIIVSRDFEVGRNVSCEESTVSPVWG